MSDYDETPEGRTPPHDVIAEQSVLGGMLLNKHAVLDVLESGLTGPDFYRPQHEQIFDAILAQHGRGEPTDAIVVGDELNRRGALARVGGPAYLHTLMSSVPTAANAGYYAKVVLGRAVLRRLIEAGTRVTQLGYDGNPADALALANAAVTQVSEVAERAAGQPSTADTMAVALDEVLESFEGETGCRVTLSTGMPDLDRALSGGVEPGHVTVLAARPGIGKSAVLGQIGLHMAGHGAAAYIESVENSRRDWIVRGISHLQRIDYGRLQKAQNPKGHPDRVDLTEAEWRGIATGHARLNAMPFHVAARPQVTVQQIITGARSFFRAHPGLPRVVGIDYLQLVTPADRRIVREQQIAQMTRDIKTSLAGGLECAVILLSQLNRGAAQRRDPRPTIVDLRESGAIENDADNIVLLHRDDDADDPTAMEAILAKARRGPQVAWDLEWQGCYQTAAAKRWTPTSALDGRAA